MSERLVSAAQWCLAAFQYVGQWEWDCTTQLDRLSFNSHAGTQPGALLPVRLFSIQKRDSVSPLPTWPLHLASNNQFGVALVSSVITPRLRASERGPSAPRAMDAALLVTVLVPAVAALLVLGSGAASASPPRAFFVFGDSLVDNGNNNYLMTTARADAPPYGIDFPTHLPTGRFSNGLNIPDIISEHLGSQPALPYLSPDLRGDQLLVGANFASAGVGILNDTGIQFVSNNRDR
jgi:hypothetical protein